MSESDSPTLQTILPALQEDARTEFQVPRSFGSALGRGWKRFVRYFRYLIAGRPDGVLQSLVRREERLRVLREMRKSPGKPTRQELLRDEKLAITDLFVETALDLLDTKAKAYQRRGRHAFYFGLLLIVFGVGVAHVQLGETEVDLTGTALALHLIRGFTFYGLVVLAAVQLWRLGKAQLDQAERLHDRRHALRQGRLYVHLRDGNIDIEELERAFAWNLAQLNAFADLSTDAKAPTGLLVSEAVKLVEASVKLASVRPSYEYDADPNEDQESAAASAPRARKVPTMARRRQPKSPNLGASK